MSRLLLISVLLLSACSIQVLPKEIYERDPAKRRVNVDDHSIYVVPVDFGNYVAWGGEEDHDGFVEYRQKRAIELISRCRVHTGDVKHRGAVLMTSVSC